MLDWRGRLVCVAMSLLVLANGLGCSLIPEIAYQPQHHNPFPQLSRVAVLPFFNLSDSPNVNQREVAQAFYIELQQIPGFDVMPVGVVEEKLKRNHVLLDEKTDYQKIARDLGVDAVIRGAVTVYSQYYPPRMAITTDWFAANPGFHPIPPGYGLPWGTPDEEFIPNSLVNEAEFALAREQLKTQTPFPQKGVDPQVIVHASPNDHESANDYAQGANQPGACHDDFQSPVGAGLGTGLPPDWPDPRGFIPPPPQPHRPPFWPQIKPIISHVRLYDGHDADFTQRLAAYYYFRDDARFGGWQNYLQRSEDFTRFCCYLHITETLAARGGAGETRVVWRWPIDRYQR